MKCTLKNQSGHRRQDYRVREVVEVDCRADNREVVLAIALVEDDRVGCSQVWENTGELSDFGWWLSANCPWAFSGPNGDTLSTVGRALRAGLVGMTRERLVESLPVNSYTRKRGMDISEEQYSEWVRLGENAPSLRREAA